MNFSNDKNKNATFRPQCQVSKNSYKKPLSVVTQYLCVPQCEQHVATETHVDQKKILLRGSYYIIPGTCFCTYEQKYYSVFEMSTTLINMLVFPLMNLFLFQDKILSASLPKNGASKRGQLLLIKAYLVTSYLNSMRRRRNEKKIGNKTGLISATESAPWPNKLSQIYSSSKRIRLHYVTKLLHPFPHPTYHVLSQILFFTYYTVL